MSAVDVAGMFRQAVAAHRQGNIAEAEALCRTLLNAAPNHADAIFLLAGIASASRRPSVAADLLRRAIAIDPRRAEYHGNLGAILARGGRLDEAIACFKAAIACDPRAPAGHIALGNALQAKGDLDGAIASFEAAAAAEPASVAAKLNLGNALRAAGRLAEAEAALRVAARLAPAVPEVQHNLGIVLFAQHKLAEAEAAFGAALAAKPDFALARRQRALVFIAQGRIDEASALLLADLRPARALGAPGADNSFRRTNRIKLTHDRDQLAYLRDRGLINDGMAATVAAYDRLLAMSVAGGGDAFDIPAAAPEVAALHSRLIHIRQAPVHPAGALAQTWDGQALQAEFRRRDPGHAVIDGLLRPAALVDLQAFCRESTVWYQMTFANEVSATMFQGFCCPLLLQIANELRERLPALLGDKPLMLAWAYKYCGPFSGLGVHADDGAVSVNFWITPDEANLDAERGGLVLWDRRVPERYLRKDRVTQAAMIQAIIDDPGATATTVPYRCNRAIVFDSMIAHSTDRFRFRDGYENRRVNITLLFGSAA